MNTSSSDYPTLSPYLTVARGAEAIEFYKNAFGATERSRLTNSTDGRIGHVELLIHGSLVMLSDEHPDWGNKSPESLGGSPVTLCLIVEDADAAFDRALAAGATTIMPVEDQFYGFRGGCILDPFGHQWMLQHQIEKLSQDELQKRWDDVVASCSGNDGE